MGDATTALLKIYAGGFALGLAPLFFWVVLQRRLNMSRRARAVACAAIAAVTVTPVLFAPGWFAVFLPVSLGYWLVPDMLGWTLRQVIPEMLVMHGISLAATSITGLFIGWYVKPLTGRGRRVGQTHDT